MQEYYNPVSYVKMYSMSPALVLRNVFLRG
jgi:hypothetical protein